MRDHWELDPDTFSLEMNFMLTLLRAEQTGEDEQFVRARKAGVEWSRFMECVNHHKVYPLIVRQLRKFSVAVPEHVIHSLERMEQHNRFRMLHLLAELHRLCSSFHHAGIRMLVMKGPLLAQSLYGDIALRTSKDLDLLISIDDLELAESILIRMGYRIIPGMPRVFDDWKWREHHFSYHNPSSDIQVELHWRMHPNVHYEPGFEELWAKRHTTESGDYEIHTLSKTDLFLYLVVHGARHGWFRLRWLIDICRMIEILDQNDWPLILEQARRLQVMSVLGQSLYLASRLFHVLLPDELEKLAVQKRALRQAQDAVTYIRDMVRLNPVPETRELAAHYKKYLMSLLTFRKKIVYVISALYPNSWDTVHFPLPRKMYFLYIPLRPFLWIWKSLQKDGIRHKGADV